MDTRIMAINDHEDILEIYRQFLTAKGYTARVYTDPEQALVDIEQFPPALIILDWLFNNVERGHGILRRLRANPTTATTPVVICTAVVASIPRIAEDLAASGAQVLYKPFQLRDLLTVIEAQLSASAP